MAPRKEIRQYWFTVEGETEKWYLEWLRETINKKPEALYQISIKSKVEQNPMKFAKVVNPISARVVTHWCDYESNDAAHVSKFEGILKQLRESTGSKGKNFKYNLGYSNFTFELWMVLHKKDCNGSFANRSQYLAPINSAYQENFEDLDKFKREANFKRVLNKLTLNDVASAVNRAKVIMNNNKTNKLKLMIYGRYKYYIDNPSLTIWESVEEILKDCNIM
ncbi:MAG: RloB domain-containing protein [Clostridiales bacterium]|nr:RloB domain-containing protein [Clostridiales bacterium]